MLTRQEADAIYDTGRETVMHVLLEMSRGIDRFTSELAERKAENMALREKGQTLEEQVRKNSHNSHKPPASDGLAKPKPKSLRRPSRRSAGGQPGHPGHTLRSVETPDQVVRHGVETCANCGCSLARKDPDQVERRQVFELPEPKLEVTEHQAEVKTCPCGCVNRAAFPSHVTAPVQYGPRLKSAGVYLKEYQLLPFDRVGEIMRDLFGCQSFSEGTLANFDADCSRRLQPVEAIIREQVAASAVAGFDETGMRAVGSLHRLHTASTRFLTWYYAHKRPAPTAPTRYGHLSKRRSRGVTNVSSKQDILKILPQNRHLDRNAGGAANKVKPETCSTDCTIIPTASWLSCVTSRSRSTIINRNAIYV